MTHYRHHEQSKEQIAEHAMSKLKVAADTEPGVFHSDGVGGQWTFALLEPTCAPHVRTVDVGPMLQNS